MERNRLNRSDFFPTSMSTETTLIDFYEQCSSFNAVRQKAFLGHLKARIADKKEFSNSKLTKTFWKFSRGNFVRYFYWTELNLNCMLALNAETTYV